MSGATYPTTHILIVDDNSTTRSKLLSLLSDVQDFRINDSVRNGYEGVAVALRMHPDVIVLNNNTPFLDGIDTAQYMHSRLPHTPIIMIASDDCPEQVEAAFNAGVMAFFTKPVCEVEEFTESIRFMAEIHAQMSPRSQHNGY